MRRCRVDILLCILRLIYDHKEIAEVLIAAGADVNAKNNRDMTPLHQAARSGRNEIAGLLIAKGADVNAKDENSLTPLDQAIQRKKPKTANLLRKHGGKRGGSIFHSCCWQKVTSKP